MQSPPVGGNLKDRIAALQQRSVSGTTPPQQPSSTPPKSNAGSNAGPTTGSLRSKIAKFESKGGVPIPRGSFGMGAPPEQPQGHSVSRELYGNRIASVTKPSPSISRAGPPLPGSEESPSASSSPLPKRRMSTGYYGGLPTVDLSGVTQKLSYQASMANANGTDSEGTTPATETSVSEDVLSRSARRNSLAALGAGRRTTSSSSEMHTIPKIQAGPSQHDLSSPPIDTVAIPGEAPERASTPAIIVSPEPSSTDLVAEPSPIQASTISALEEPAPSFTNASSVVTPAEEPIAVEPAVVAPPSPAKSAPHIIDVPKTPAEPSPTPAAPVTLPVTPTTTGGRQALLEHPPDSPYLEFAGSAPASPAKAAIGGSKSDVVIQRPVRTSSLAANVKPRARSPSPTPSMIHQSEVEAPVKVVARPRKPKNASKARAFANVRRTMLELPTNPTSMPDEDDDVAIYGSATLGSRSETNLLEAANKPAFSAVVHRKITEIPPSTESDIPTSQSMPISPVVKRTLAPNSSAVPPASPGYADLTALLEEAALLEAKLAAGEATNDIGEQINGPDGGFQLEPFSVDSSSSIPSIMRSASPDSMQREHKKSSPTTPSKSAGFRMLSGIRRFTSTSTGRSIKESHSRMSTSGSEFSSEDSASVNTPSENGLAFPVMHPNGSRQSMSSGLSAGYSTSPKKNGSMGRASSIADKIWHRNRTKSNNSSNSHGAC